MTNIPNIGKTAANALSSIGITELEHLKRIDENNLLKIHGVGPKAVNILKQALTGSNLKFKQVEPLSYSTYFAVLGSLGCNNAPKREMIRDFIIASYKKDLHAVSDLCSEDFNTHIPLADKNLSALEILTIITHGKEGAAEIIAVTADGEKHRFAYFINFENHKKNAKIINVSIYSK